MASSFPGTNPFSRDNKGMHTVAEEDSTHEDAGPDSSASQNPSASMDASAYTAPPGVTHTFGSSGFLSGNLEGAKDVHGQPVYHGMRRTSVSAESMNPADSNSENWTPPVHPKTDEQKGRLRQAVSPNFLFSGLDDEQTNQVLNALQEKPIPAKGIKIISQGDAGDFFYVVEKGAFDVHVHPSGQLQPGADGMGAKVASIGPGGSFGELALMYNSPRAATVVSTEPATLWALDRVTFRRILMDSAFQRRVMYESFLAEVPLLESLTPYERSKIADALHTEKYPAGHTIIKEGDPGESFFILESGLAQVFKAGNDKALRGYKKGDYFGELALLNDEPRAASVVSENDVKVAMLGKEGFQRLLGPVSDLMRRNDPRQKTEDEGVDPLTTAA